MMGLLVAPTKLRQATLRNLWPFPAGAVAFANAGATFGRLYAHSARYWRGGLLTRAGISVNDGVLLLMGLVCLKTRVEISGKDRRFCGWRTPVPEREWEFRGRLPRFPCWRTPVPERVRKFRGRMPRFPSWRTPVPEREWELREDWSEFR